jgi:hypothetical protein
MMEIITLLVPNYNRLYSLDSDTLEVMESVPKNKRSEFVRNGIKNLNQMNLNKEVLKAEIPRTTGKITGVMLD